MKLLLILVFAPALSFADIKNCESYAWGHARGRLASDIDIAVRYPRPENAKYLGCRGNELKLTAAITKNTGYIWYHYDFAVLCGVDFITYWAEFYESNGRCLWRGE